MKVAYEDTDYMLNELTTAIRELATPASKADAVEHIGRIPGIIVQNFATNKIRLDKTTQATLKGYGPRLRELAAGLPATQAEFDSTVSEFQMKVNEVLTKGSVGQGATGARRRRKTRKGKGKSRKTLRRR